MKLLLPLFLAIKLICFSQVPSYVPTNGLVGWWPFNGNVNNTGGSGLNGIVLNADLTTDRFSNANSAYNFTFNNAGWGTQNNELYIGYSPVLDVGQISISIWVYPRAYFWPGNPDNPNSTIVSRYQYGGSNPNGIAWSIGFNQNSVTGYIAGWNGTGGASVVSGPALSLNQWHHIVLTYDYDNVKLYVNGSLQTSTPHSGSMNMDGFSGISIGESNESTGYWEYTDGKIDDFGMWNRALTACEVTALYNAQLFSAGPDQTICAGTQITLTASGGANYVWSNGVQNGVPIIPSGDQVYTVTSTSGSGCVATDQVFINVYPLPTINAGVDQVVCEGDPVSLSASGGISYNWDNGVSNTIEFTPTHLGDLTYTVTGYDVNNCSNTDQVVVTVNAHSSVTQTASSLNSYIWPVNGQTYTESGTYTSVIPNTAGCDSTITLNLTLDFTGIEEKGTTGFKVYPNPVNDVLNVSTLSESNANYLVFDSRGKKVLEGRLHGTEDMIDLKELSNGAYTLNIGGKKVPVRVIKL